MNGKTGIYPVNFSQGKFSRVNIFISGLVQGVFFRSETKKKAEEFGIFGWVRNLTDGRVEILAEGKREKIERLIDWSGKGPDSSRVDNLEIIWQEYRGEFTNFEIR